MCRVTVHNSPRDTSNICRWSRGDTKVSNIFWNVQGGLKKLHGTLTEFDLFRRYIFRTILHHAHMSLSIVGPRSFYTVEKNARNRKVGEIAPSCPHLATPTQFFKRRKPRWRLTAVYYFWIMRFVQGDRRRTDVRGGSWSVADS